MTTDYFQNSLRIPVEKATNFVYHAFIQYANFFELTRDLKKNFFEEFRCHFFSTDILEEF